MQMIFALVPQLSLHYTQKNNDCVVGTNTAFKVRYKLFSFDNFLQNSSQQNEIPKYGEAQQRRGREEKRRRVKRIC